MNFLDRILGFGLVPIPKFFPRCYGCGEGITGDCLKALDRTWHPSHFRCGVCNKPLGSRFCVSHHQEPYCSSHDQGTVVCECCGHLIIGSSPTKGFCGACSIDILKDERDAAVLLGGIQTQLRKQGLPWWPQSFPVKLVGAESMQIQDHQGGTTILGVISQVTTTDSAGRSIRRVPEIRLLRGRPRLVQGAVIAHELGHAWVFQKGLQGLPKDVEEGFCEYCSHHWLGKSCDPRAPYLMDRLVRNPDPTYGGGFQKILDMAKVGGLPAVLDQLSVISQRSNSI